MFFFRSLIWIVVCLSQSACLTTASQSFQKIALSQGLEHQVLSTRQFDLSLYQNKAFAAANTLHIYIGGDGQPWLNRIYINADPTSRQPLMLKLLSIDPTPAIYLGRPCYHTHGQGLNCDSKWWTSHRYSAAVVNAMTQAAEAIIQQKMLNQTPQVALRVSLIGFSGGGTLATLISQRLSQVTNLVTINGNLDIDAWTQHHGYSLLDGSINPSQSAMLPTQLRKFHLVGAQDRNVPLSINALKNFRQQANTQVLRYEKQTHDCCWEAPWLDFLNQHLIKHAP